VATTGKIGYNSGNAAGGALPLAADRSRGEVMEQVKWLAVGLVALMVLGLFIGVAGVVALVRQGRSWRTFFYVTFAVLSLGTAGVIGAARWHLIREIFKKDVDDPDVLRGASRTEEGRKPAEPGEWPQWRGYHRDGLSPENGPLLAWSPKGPKEVWHKPLGGGYASVSVSGGRLYTMDRQGGQERVVCLDPKTGDVLGEYHYDADYNGLQFQYARGPRATPTVHDGRVYTVGATGVFLCLEAAPANGKLKLLWRKNLLEDFDGALKLWGVACSPLVEGDFVIVQPGGKKGSIVAFDRKTGKQIWTALDDPSGYSSPVAATTAGVRQLVCFTARRMVGLRPSDGSLLWQYAWATQNDGNIATPIVAGDLVFLSSDYGSGCALLRLSPDGDGVKAQPAFVRRNKLMRNHHSSCVLVGDYLYGFDVGGQRVFLRCVKLDTFEEKWSTDELEKGCLLYVSGFLVVLSENGVLSLVKATPEGYNKAESAEVLDSSQSWALPALAGGRLYLRDHEKVVCLELMQ